MTSKKHEILVIGDSRVNIRVIHETLRSEHRVMVATSYEQAETLIDSLEPPDLIVLDVVLSDRDGIEACRKIKSKNSSKEVPIIFITSGNEHVDETMDLDLVAVDCITRPVVPDVLKARVRTQLQLREQQLELKQALSVIREQRNKMQKDLDVVTNLQRSLQPKLPNQDKRIEVSAKTKSTPDVGGDFYDVFHWDEDVLCACVGNVFDSGIRAALLKSMSRSLVRTQSSGQVSTAKIVAEVNNEIIQNNDTYMFITLLVLLINLRTGELTYTNAGHDLAMIKKANGVVNKLSLPHGTPVGVEGVLYDQDKIQLDTGDALLLYTDSMSEAGDPAGEQVGKEKLERFVAKEDFSKPSEAVNKIAGVLNEIRGNEVQADDATLLCLQFKGQPEEVLGGHVLKLDVTDISDFNRRVKDYLNSIRIREETHTSINLVLDEIVSNITTHGFPGDKSSIEIEIRVVPRQDGISIHVSDNGVFFNPLDALEPDLESDLQGRELGGLGIYLCRKLMDDVSYERRGDTNHLTLLKLAGAEEHAKQF